MALGVIGALIVIELLPEAFELLQESYRTFITIVMIIGFSVLGFLIVMALENFIPNHGEGHDKELFHLGLVSSIAIIFHNIIEGMAIYATTIGSFSTGMLMSIGVGLHNIPMGMVVMSSLDKARTNLLKTSTIIATISLSTFVGGLIMYFNNGILNNDTLLGIILSITQVMLVYIVIFELWSHIHCCNHQKTNILGIILGILIFIISHLL
jgi:ZIP family zinc transporter